MSGAYVAKPAVAVDPPEGPPTVDDVPPGWDLNWPFPGPYPPGYAPELTLPMTATEVIMPSGTAAVTGEFRDHTDFLTHEPDAVILTATIDDEAVNLRFTGDTEYASSISSNCTLAEYWNIAPGVEFELTRSAEGKTLVLTGTSAVDGVSVVGTADIVIYAFLYSLNMSGPSGMTYDETASVTASLRDHATLGTDEPTGSTLTWTATIDGAAVGLRFSGDTEYSSSISSAYSDIGDYWGAEKDIEFDLTEDNDEDTVVLRVESTVFGEDLATTHDIVIGEPYAIVTLTMTGNQEPRFPDPHFGASLHFYGSAIINGTPSGYVYHKFNNTHLTPPYWEPDPRWEFTHNARPGTLEDLEFEVRSPVADGQVLVGDQTEDGVPYPEDWLIGECNGNQIIIKARRFKPYWVLPWVPMTYTIAYSIYKNNTTLDVTLDFILVMYSAGGDVLDTWTKQIVVADGEGDIGWMPKVTWLTISGTTREVTVINP